MQNVPAVSPQQPHSNQYMLITIAAAAASSTMTVITKLIENH